MEDNSRSNDDRNFDKDSLSDESISHDSLLNDKYSDCHEEESRLSRKGSYTIELTSEMSQSIRNMRKPLFIKTDMSRHSYASEKSSDEHMRSGNVVTQKNMMTQSMYERPWSSSKKNNSISSAISKQREAKLRLAKEEQSKKLKQKVEGLTEAQKQAEVARKRKENEMIKKLEEKKIKALERQKIVEERKKRLAQAEEARKSRILQKMTNHEEKHSFLQTSIMTMSCYGAVGSSKVRTGNKEVVKDRFTAKRPVSSTGKIIGFGSSSPRSICENSIKTAPKQPPKISDYLMERSQILSRPVSSRMPDRMIISVISPSLSASQNRPMARQNSLKEKRRPVSAMVTSVIDDTIKHKPTRQSKYMSIKENGCENKGVASSTHLRVSSRKSNPTQLTKPNNTQTKPVRDRPSSAKPIQHANNLTERGIIQSKSSTFPKSKDAHQSRRSKVDVHLDSDSIEDEGLTLTESLNQGRSITSSISHKKSEINRTDLSSADSLDTENSKEKISNNAKSENIKLDKVDGSSSAQLASGRALPTKDLTEADYKARLMENRRLIREKREREREQLMKAERERRHLEEATVREIMELEKNKILISEDPQVTTSNDDATEYKSKMKEVQEGATNDKQQESSISIEISQPDQTPENNIKLEKEEKERLERKKRLESIMSRLKKTNEESSSEGGGVSPRRAMSPELAEIDTETSTATQNQVFRSTLLQSMLNKGKLSGISKTPSPSVKEPEEMKLFQENLKDNANKKPFVRYISIAQLSSSENLFVHSNSNQTSNTVPLTSLRESIEDSESLQINVNSKSSVAVRSSGIDGNSLSDANSDFVVDPETFSNSSVTNNIVLKVDREDCDGQEDHFNENVHSTNCDETNPKEANNSGGPKNYSSTSSIETEEEEIKNPFNQDHVYNNHIIRPLTQEGFVSQS